MADVDISLSWAQRGLELRAHGRSGNEVVLDGDGQTGTTPVEALLISLAACMAADIVDIAGKMRLPIASLDVSASGMRNPEPPRRYLSMRLVFTIGGVGGEDAPKLARALELSEEKYCSVMHTLRPDVEVTTELVRLEPSEETDGGR